ncbi:MAG TPA: class I SAM-dependent methyltransferase, partial [Nitrospira sp.]|nr:class I SAM-dependent methyltransferase [Nitrospira sp.]
MVDAGLRRFARVTSTDYVPALLDKGRERARAEGLDVRFQEADVEELPFPDGSFDAVLSTFGAMFAPDQARTAREMMRV